MKCTVNKGKETNNKEEVKAILKANDNVKYLLVNQCKFGVLSYCANARVCLKLNIF